ncbi:MAG TPA: exodeoxyribonuclease V subunit alpha [Fibrobacteraceae bacterium]|nr:exodeoxyribonuclease V subunit alpha [Fibrobacteraceae bacterium]
MNAEQLGEKLLSNNKIGPLELRQAHFFAERFRLLSGDGKRVDSLQQLLLLLLAAQQRGAALATVDFLLHLLSDLSEDEYRDQQNLLEGLAEQPDFWAPLLGPAPKDSEGIPLVVVEQGRFAFGRNWWAARRLSHQLKFRLSCPAKKTPIDVAPILKEIFETFSPLPPGLHFHERQVAAAALALRTPLLIISGAPGTGKTSVALQILRALIRQEKLLAEDMALCAPTGRAQARLAESLRQGCALLPLPLQPADSLLPEIPAKTLHRLLGARPDGSFRHNTENPLPQRVVLLDEASMVDLPLFAALLEALSPDCRLILLGDMHQLPPVEAGAILGDLTGGLSQENATPTLEPATVRWLEQATGFKLASLALRDGTPRPVITDHAIVLTQSYRSTPGIQQVCSWINQGNTQVALAHLRQNVFADIHEIPCKNGVAAEQILAQWFAEQYPQAYQELLQRLCEVRTPLAPWEPVLREVFTWLNRSRILCVTHQGMHGRLDINRNAGQWLRQQTDPHYFGKRFHGEPILLTRNHPELELYNGDLGLVLRPTNGGSLAVFQGRDGFLAIPCERLSGLESAFAMTVHKAQGSEFTKILFVLPEQDTPLLHRQILYTALTRARNFAAVLDPKNLLETAISRKEERPASVFL